MVRYGSTVLGTAIAATLMACIDYAGPLPATGGTTASPPLSNPVPSSPVPSSPVPSSPAPTTPVTGASGGSAGASPSAAQAGAGGVGFVSFDSDVHPILVAKCGLCHNVPSPATPAHGAADAEAAFAAVQGMSMDQPVYVRILVRASGDDPAGYMPPPYAGCEGPLGAPNCLTQDEYDLIDLWIEQGASNR